LVHFSEEPSMPVAPAQQPTQRARTSENARVELTRQGRWRIGEGALAGTTILVVDDDHRNLLAMTALLERGRADVMTASSGPAGISALSQTPTIDIVLMDILMPGMDGYDTIRAIRAIDRFRSLPIVAVTGKVVAGERERCIDAGANDYVPKPVDTFELVEAISPWLP
jgi:CheY-like chemotaxis protein